MFFPAFDHLSASAKKALNISVDPALLKETVVLKLNGGLGTSMGLDKVGKPQSINESIAVVEIWKKKARWKTEKIAKWIKIA